MKNEEYEDINVIFSNLDANIMYYIPLRRRLTYIENIKVILFLIKLEYQIILNII